ncbi:MAG: hypothetical protein IKE53_03940 [Clostridiales bacterium]|nr:hypothetical protein [Clostridiales bacterium]
MTATVPDDMQISIGQIGSTASTASTSEDYSLATNTGILVNTSGVVTAPRNNEANDALDWSNTVDISKYYQFGRLIPASSTNGVNVFFTPDSAGVGKTLKNNAAFYQAAAGATAYEWASATSTFAANGGGDSAMATAHIDSTSGGNDTWTTTTYAKSTSWTETNDDGYYVDIPVWLRTSSAESLNVYVSGFVTDKTADLEDGDDLYQAVRVAILTDAGAADQGCLTLADGGTTLASTGHYPAHNDDANILDSDNYNTRTGVSSGINAVSATTPAWTTITQNNATNAVATLNAGTGTAYGDATKLIIRVWLEGEDGNCWNDNAGQDWNICLKFMKDALPAT